MGYETPAECTCEPLVFVLSLVVMFMVVVGVNPVIVVIVVVEVGLGHRMVWFPGLGGWR